MIALGIIFAGVHTELAQGPAPVSARLISIQQLPEDVCMWDPVEPELKATLSAPLEAGSCVCLVIIRLLIGVPSLARTEKIGFDMPNSGRGRRTIPSATILVSRGAKNA
jgi:hypothetical protein